MVTGGVFNQNEIIKGLNVNLRLEFDNLKQSRVNLRRIGEDSIDVTIFFVEISYCCFLS